MRRFRLVTRSFQLLVSVALVSATLLSAQPAAIPKRIVILKVDGLNADLLFRTMDQVDARSGKSKLPWFTHIFRENGTVFEDFFTRGISLSAPSWSMLDTGHHTIIRGNAEYDRYTGDVYDYLNAFPFYIRVARSHQEDMPGVEVLDRAGIPLLSDRYSYAEVLQSLQLYQRGVRWDLLARILKAKFSSKGILSLIEGGSEYSLDQVLLQQEERELIGGLQRPEVLYLDLYSGDVDHETHAINSTAAIEDVLVRLDGVAGRIWTAIQASRDAADTLFVTVSDHGMNNVPEVHSQAFNLPDLFNSPAGGGHHVVTNRHQLSDFSLRAINPLANRIVTPSTTSFYLQGQASSYPTAWLDLDGNERASVHLRNSDFNKIHILLLQLARSDLTPNLRRAAAEAVTQTINSNRETWARSCDELSEELAALHIAIIERRKVLDSLPKKWTNEQRATGERAVSRRLTEAWQAWTQEEAEYRDYVAHIRALLSLTIDAEHSFTGKISELIPELSLGPNNTLYQLQSYVAGVAAGGLVLNGQGGLDEQQSFRHINYFALLPKQRVRNNPEPAVSSEPIDFSATALPDAAARHFDSASSHAYWLVADDDRQLVILQRSDGAIALRPVASLCQLAGGDFQWKERTWTPGLPLEIFEDKALRLSPDADRGQWLRQWHSEREWFNAIYETRYSNGVIGITEQFSPVADNVPGTPTMPPLLLRYEKRRRELVTPDFQIFASDHWNFNARNFNPGGNHGSFLRISTHSVWMMAGANVPIATVTDPYDSLNFASTVLQMLGKTVPMPERVVSLKHP